MINVGYIRPLDFSISYWKDLTIVRIIGASYNILCELQSSNCI